MYSRVLAALSASVFLGSCGDGGEGGRDPLQILTVDLPDAALGTPYLAVLRAAGGVAPYTWAVDPEALPAGVVVTREGAVNGTPTEAGDFTMTSTVVDSVGAMRSQAIRLRVEVMSLPGGRCEAPTAVVLTDGRASFDVPTGSDPTNASGVCGGDADTSTSFFSIELATPAEVTAQVTSAQPVEVALMGDACPTSDDYLSCAARVTSRLPAGRHRFVVVSVAGVPFTMTITADADAITEGTCEDPIEVLLEEGRTMLSGRFEQPGVDTALLSCGDEARRDVVYRLELAEPADLRIDASSAVVALNDGDCGDLELMCNGTPPYLVRRPAGTYDLIVEQRYESQETYQLVVERLPPTARPANDRCAQAERIDPSAGPVRLFGSWIAAEDEGYRSCGAPRALYYDVVLTERAAIEVIDAQNNSAIEIRNGCIGVPIVCDTASGLCPSSLEPGTYVLRIAPDRDDAWDRPFDVTVAMRPELTRPENDTCESAEFIDAASGPVTTERSIQFAGTEATSVVCPNASPSADVFYRLNLVERSDVAVRLTSSRWGAFEAAIFSGDCANPVAPRCLRPSTGATAYGLPPGPTTIALTYSDEVEGLVCSEVRPTHYALEIAVSASLPAPPNDTCASPTPIALDAYGSIASVAGTTRGAADDVDLLACPDEAQRSTGLDVFYAVTLALPGRLRVTPTDADDTFSLSLHTVSCASTNALRCTRAFGDRRLETPFALLAGTYFLRVEQANRSGSDPIVPADFSYAIELLAP